MGLSVACFGVSFCTADMLSFQQKMWDSVRRLTFIQQFSPAWHARDIYTTMHEKNQFKVMLWITVLNSVNMEDFSADTFE